MDKGDNAKIFFGPSAVKLHNGIVMPTLGLGTSHSGGFSHTAVVHALKQCGYRLIDTAKRYGCEEMLSLAIEESGVPRQDIFLTTKLWPTDYGSETARSAFFGSLKRLNTDYVDLYMLHWPYCSSAVQDKEQQIIDTWRTLETLYDEGYCRAIGVSNFEETHLESVLENCSIVPHVNQVEYHPYQHPSKLHYYCQEHNIQMEGYCPLGKGQFLWELLIQQVAIRCNRTPAQILIRWSIQNGVVTIPKSTKTQHIKENSQVFDFMISEDDMMLLNSLHDGRRAVNVVGIQAKIDSQDEKDGYKLHLKPESEKSNYRIYS